MRALAALAAAALALACGHRRPLVAPPPLASPPPPQAYSPQVTSPPAGATLAPSPGPTAAEPHEEPDLLGVTHAVKKGETLYRIAKTYGISPRDLMEVNGLSDPRQLEIGVELFIPGARRSLEVPGLPGAIASGASQTPPEEDQDDDEEAARPSASGAAAKTTPPRPPAPPTGAPPAPTAHPSAPASGDKAALHWPVKGVLYSRFGMRQGQRHDGIDVAAPEGSAVTAAADGLVVYAGEQTGYGHVVILRHAGGLLTLYAHMSKVMVTEGAKVKAGDAIARVGQSGRTSGPHLHFEVREGTRPRNPLLYLK